MEEGRKGEREKGRVSGVASSFLILMFSLFIINRSSFQEID
jgi:hypothetical protein